MSSFGGQTMTFIVVAETGAVGRMGIREKSRTPEVVVEGCHFRPFRGRETPDSVTNVATETWKGTVPPVEAVLSAKFTGEVKVGDVTYQMDGPVQPKYNLDGSVHHVTVFCKKQADG